MIADNVDLDNDNFEINTSAFQTEENLQKELNFRISCDWYLLIWGLYKLGSVTVFRAS